MDASMRNSIYAATLLAAGLVIGHATPAAAKFEVVQVDLNYPVGSVVIVNSERKLYYITGNGRAIRYGVAVGKPEELWMGRTFVTEKKVDPRWVPVDGSDPVDGGDDENPLGKRALYLDWSLLRIHGTPSRGSIGRAVSNGCVRMLNEDVMDLFERVHLGAPVFAISSREEAGWYRDAKVGNREFANPTARANKEAAEKAAKQ
jgi:lipoprotein-anchoring transpeptidase ErfK/SrfK